MAKLNIKQQRAIQHHLNENPRLKLALSVPSAGQITFVDKITRKEVDVSLVLMELNYTSRVKQKKQTQVRMKKELNNE